MTCCAVLSSIHRTSSLCCEHAYQTSTLHEHGAIAAAMGSPCHHRISQAATNKGFTWAEARNDAPALLLVHGFGAFGEQWRGQVKALTAAGYQAREVIPSKKQRQMHRPIIFA